MRRRSLKKATEEAVVVVVATEVPDLETGTAPSAGPITLPPGTSALAAVRIALDPRPVRGVRMVVGVAEDAATTTVATSAQGTGCASNAAPTTLRAATPASGATNPRVGNVVVVTVVATVAVVAPWRSDPGTGTVHSVMLSTLPLESSALAAGKVPPNEGVVFRHHIQRMTEGVE